MESALAILKSENQELRLENMELRARLERPGLLSRLRSWWIRKRLEACTEIQDERDGIEYEGEEPDDGEF